MNYFLQDPNGKESGPFSQDVLIDMANAGKITSDYSVRNSMMKKWRPAKAQVFLEDIIKSQEKSKESSIKRNITAEGNEKGAAKSLTMTETSIAAPTLLYRAGATLVDLHIVALICLIAYQAVPSLSTPDNKEQTLNFWLAFSVIILQVYYTFNITYYAQTLGQRFFGLMAIKDGTLGKPVLAGRAFSFTIFLFLMAPINLLLILLFNRGLHESFSGARIVNTRLG